MQNASSLFEVLSSSSASRDFINAMLSDNGVGLRLLIEVLDSAGSDELVLRSTNAALYSMASNLDALKVILQEGTNINVTTLRWLTNALAMLSSDKEFLLDTYVTDETSHPVPPELTYTREIQCPLASRLVLTFHEKSEVENALLTLTSDDNKLEFSAKASIPKNPIVIEGSKITVSYASTGPSKWGYRLDIQAVFDTSFDGVKVNKNIIESGGLRLLAEKAITSKDPATQSMASRALANLMFVPSDETSQAWKNAHKQVVEVALPKLYNLLEATTPLQSSLFDTVSRSRGREPQLIVLNDVPLENISSTVVYFEATLESSTKFMIGYCANKDESIDGFDTPVPESFFVLDGFNGEIRSGKCSKKIDTSSWGEGDCIGVRLDLMEGKISFSMNGTELSALSRSEHGDPSVWEGQFCPVALIGEGAGIHWNFGQVAFRENGSELSLFECCRGARPTHAFQQKSWMKFSWEIFDRLSKSWRNLNTATDKLIQSDSEIRLLNSSLLYNHKRQIARALYGASLQHMDEKIVKQAIALSYSEDLCTRKWSIRLLLGLLKESKANADSVNLVLQDSGCIANIVRASDSNVVNCEEVFNSFFFSRPLGFELAHKYLQEVPSGQDVSPFAIYESSHPYADGLDDIFEVYVPGCKEIEIVFHPLSSTELNYDHITFYSANPATCDNVDDYKVSEALSGGRGSTEKKFPFFDSPLLIPHNKVWAKFHSDGSNNDWGYKFLARAAIAKDKSSSSAPVSLYASHVNDVGAVIIECPSHPYEDDFDWIEKCEIAGAQAIGIVFDPMTCTEQTHDYVTFAANEDESDNFYGGQKFSGGRGGSMKSFPGLSGNDPLVIEANKFCVKFHSDSSNNDWGFRFVAFPCDLPHDPLVDILEGPHEVFESSHPYESESDIDIPVKVDFPGCKSVNIIFDKQSAIQKDGAYITIFKDDTKSDHWGEEKYTGKSLPSAKCPIKVDSLDFNVTFHSDDSSDTAWGYKFYVVPWYPDDLTKWAGELGEVVESKHPYDDNMNVRHEVDWTGVAAIEVAFDERSATESGCDFLQFLSTYGSVVPGTAEKYSGREKTCFPRISNPLRLDVDAFVMTFFSDGSSVDWGYRVAFRPILSSENDNAEDKPKDIFNELSLQQEQNSLMSMLCNFFLKASFYATIIRDDLERNVRCVDCPRDERMMYLPFLAVRSVISFPGAITMQVDFDSRTETEKDGDFIQFYSKPDYDSRSLVPGKSFSGKFDSEWNFEYLGQRLFYSFESDAQRSAWGYKFCVRPKYYSIVASNTTEVFKNKDFVLSVVDSARRGNIWSGLLLTNALRSEVMCKWMIKAYSIEWLQVLLCSSCPEVLLATLQSFLHGSSSDESFSLSPGAKELILSNNLIEKFVMVLMTNDVEMKAMALVVLKGCLNISGATNESILLECLASNSDIVRSQALQELAKAAEDAALADKFIQLKCISQLKSLVYNHRGGDSDLKAEAINALVHLLQTESAVSDFLSGEDGVEGFALLTSLFSQNDASVAVKLLSALIKKQRAAASLSQKNFSLGLSDCIDVINESVQLRKSLQPMWVADNVTKKTQGKQKSAGQTANNVHFTYSFWVLPQDVSDAVDGVPIIYKGAPYQSIHNHSKSSTEKIVRLDLLAVSGKVYLEVTYETAGSIACGWASARATFVDGFSSDVYAYGVSLPKDSPATLLWGGFASVQAISSVSGVPSSNPGDVLGLLLDFDNGSMSFSLNGVMLPQMVFWSDEHGKRPRANNHIRENVSGADWYQGMYPTFSVASGEEFTINAGLEPFKFKPDNFVSILQSVKGSSSIPPILLTLVKNEENSSQSWEPVGSNLLREHVEEEILHNSIVISLLPSLRLCFKAGATSSVTKWTSVSFTAQKSLALGMWSHVVVCVDADSVDFFINGIMDASHMLDGKSLLYNPHNIGIGFSPASKKAPGGSSSLWLSCMSYFKGMFMSESQVKEMFHNSIPLHLQTSLLACSYMHNLPSLALEKVKQSASDTQDDFSRVILNTLVDMTILSSGDELGHVLGLETITSYVNGCFQTLLSEESDTEAKVDASKLLSKLSASFYAKIAIIKCDGIRSMLALSDPNTHFWLEIAICNTCLSKDEEDIAKRQFGLRVEDYIYFKRPVQPFADAESDKNMWRKIPIAIYPMTREPAVFVKIARTIGIPILSLDSFDAVSATWSF